MHVKNLALCVWEWRRYTIQYNMTLWIRFQVVIQHILRSFHTRWTHIVIPCLVWRENNSTWYKKAVAVSILPC